MYAGRVDWAGTMLMFNALPPDPARFRGDWQAAWQARLEANRPPLATWLRHQTRDAYWQDKALAGEGRTLTTPLYVLAGQADKYKTALFRTLSIWQGPARGVLGPWEHTYPSIAETGPAIGYGREGLRWWDHWLKGAETGVMERAAVTAWVSGAGTDGEGAWVGVPAWPDADLQSRSFALDADNRLTPGAPNTQGNPRAPIRLTTQAQAETPLPDDIYDDAPRAVDLYALRRAGAQVFLSAPLEEDLTVFSVPVLRFTATCDQPKGLVAVRLLDVAPDGTTRMVSKGAQNLVFTTGYESLRPCRADEPLSVSLMIEGLAHRFRAGHRLALALCGQDWPVLVPPPVAGHVHVDPSSLRLDLPLLDPDADDLDAPFEAPDMAPPPAVGAVRRIDMGALAIAPAFAEPDASHSQSFGGLNLADTDTDFAMSGRFDLKLVGENRQHMRAACQWRARFDRPGWQASLDTELSCTATERFFLLEWRTVARNGEAILHDGRGDTIIPREAF